MSIFAWIIFLLPFIWFGIILLCLIIGLFTSGGSDKLF